MENKQQGDHKMEIKTYWNQSGKYQAEYDALYDTLIPSMGNASTLEGELLRAISKIYYDAYNNGYGNNLSGAYNFLVKHAYGILPMNFCKIKELVNGPYIGNGIEYNESLIILEDTVNAIIEHVISKNGNYTMSDVDIYDLQQPDYEE